MRKRVNPARPDFLAVIPNFIEEENYTADNWIWLVVKAVIITPFAIGIVSLFMI